MNTVRSSKRAISHASILSAVILFTGTPAILAAQGVGIAVHGGTLGVGADLAVSPVSRIALRGGANFIPVDVDFTYSGTPVTLDPPSPQYTAFLDLFLVGGLRITGGAVFSPDDVVLTGNFTGTIDIGNTTYSLAEVGKLTGTIVNDDVAPYVGIGWGNPAGSRFGFFLDLGIAFQGKPSVVLSANGTASTLLSFATDLEQERQDFENDIDLFRYYPVASIGFSIGLSR
ncbi:MAG: hypothetical protein ACE5HT_11100 [Gemmatimonadales bacterium]